MCLMTVRGVRATLTHVAPIPVCRYQELRFSSIPSNADGHRDAEANGRDRAGRRSADHSQPSSGSDTAFPVSEEKIYLSICDSTVLAQPVRAAVDRFLDQVMYWREERSTRDSVVEATRAKFAALIGGQEGDVAIVKNVSEGINAIATAFDWRPGDNVVLCASLEHPNNVIPWLHLKRRGVEVRIVPPSDGAIDPQQIIANIDEHTRVVTCSSVTFAPGLRTDLAPIGRACRDRGVFFLVDAVQSVGILRLNVEVEFIDGLVVSTAKGLLGLYGMGFLYCRRHWAQRLVPAYLSRPAVDLPPDRYSEMASFKLEIRPDARRFEVGSVDYASCYAADAALDLIFSIGPDVDRGAHAEARRSNEARPSSAGVRGHRVESARQALSHRHCWSPWLRRP